MQVERERAGSSPGHIGEAGRQWHNYFSLGQASTHLREEMEEEHISVADNAAIKDIVEAARTRPHGANCVHSRLGTVKWWEELFSHFVVPFGSSSIRKPDLRPQVFTCANNGQACPES